jgi:DNA-binding XRE family transcriptional regulator
MVNPLIRSLGWRFCLSTEIPSPRMIRAARGLLGIGQAQLAEYVGVDRRTIIRIEAEDTTPTNSRRLEICENIRTVLEKNYGIKFVFSSSASGEGVVMKRSK